MVLMFVESAIYMHGLLLTTGNALHCYRCQNPQGQVYSPEQCIQSQVIETCGDGNYTCFNISTKTTENNETNEGLVKGCLSEDNCLALNERCNAIIANGGECNYSCCQHDLCNDEFKPEPLKCYHCDGPFVNRSLGLNDSSALNQSYTTSQCARDQREVLCASGSCARFFRRFKNYENLDVEIELRSCLSFSQCAEVSKFCAKVIENVNNTEICQFRCCDYDFCNSASRDGFASSLFITFAIIFTVSHF